MRLSFRLNRLRLSVAVCVLFVSVSVVVVVAVAVVVCPIYIHANACQVGQRLFGPVSEWRPTFVS